MSTIAPLERQVYGVMARMRSILKSKTIILVKAEISQGSIVNNFSIGKLQDTRDV